MTKTLILLLVLAIVAFLGCASRHISNEKSQTSKQILDITIDDNPESVVLSIKGNQVLTYTSEVEQYPMGLILSFPKTAADNVLGRFIPPQNEMINYIRIGNFVEGGIPLAVVFVALTQDSKYDVVSEKNNVQVYFSKKKVASSTLEYRKEPSTVEPTSGPKPNPEPIPKTASPASKLKEVATASHGNSTTVMLEANGTITDYQTFKLINPDRIVFDLHNLKSPYRRQKTIDVQSELVLRIRYYGHPDKLRLVIETRNSRRLKYTSESTDTSLKILITPP